MIDDNDNEISSVEAVDFDELGAQASTPATRSVLEEVAQLRRAVDDREGYFRDYADATPDGAKLLAAPEHRALAELLAHHGRRAWAAQLQHAVDRVVLVAHRPVRDPVRRATLRAGLLHIAEVCVSWVEAIDARNASDRASRALMRPLPWWRRAARWARGLLGIATVLMLSCGPGPEPVRCSGTRPTACYCAISCEASTSGVQVVHPDDCEPLCVEAAP